MNKRFLIALILLLLLSTYQIQDSFKFSSKSKIEKIVVQNNIIIDDLEVKERLSYLYETNLFFLKEKEIENRLKVLDFIESFRIKKIYPNEIIITIYEKEPVAIIQNKREKKYYTNKGEVINFIKIKSFDNLPLVFGDEKNFKIFYNNLRKNNFPIEEIKIFHLFNSKRWDFVTRKNQTIKLPLKNYSQSLKNFISIKDQANFEQYKTFDYRINDQLILK